LGCEGFGNSVVGVLYCLRDKPNDGIGSEAHTNKDTEDCRSENNKHCGVTPEFECSLKPVTGVRLSIAGVEKVMVDVLPAVLTADDQVLEGGGKTVKSRRAIERIHLRQSLDGREVLWA